MKRPAAVAFVDVPVVEERGGSRECTRAGGQLPKRLAVSVAADLEKGILAGMGEGLYGGEDDVVGQHTPSCRLEVIRHAACGDGPLVRARTEEEMRRCRRVGGESGRGDDPGWLTLLSREVAVVPVCTPAMMQADPDGTGLATVAIATGALIFGGYCRSELLKSIWMRNEVNRSLADSNLFTIRERER